MVVKRCMQNDRHSQKITPHQQIFILADNFCVFNLLIIYKQLWVCRVCNTLGCRVIIEERYFIQYNDTIIIIGQIN